MMVFRQIVNYVHFHVRLVFQATLPVQAVLQDIFYLIMIAFKINFNVANNIILIINY